MLAACTLPTMNTIQQTAIKLLPGVRMVTSREEASRETFVTRLHKMIGSSPDDVVCWSEDGSSFAIRDLQAFQTVLRQKFRQSSMSSFVRQLNEYGFRKLRRKGRPTPSASSSSVSASGFTASAIATGADKSHHYAHERFQRDTPELLGTIQRRQAYSGNRRNREYDDEAVSSEVTEERVARLEDGIEGVRVDMQKVNEMLELALKEVQLLPEPVHPPHPQARVAIAAQAQGQCTLGLPLLDSLLSRARSGAQAAVDASRSPTQPC